MEATRQSHRLITMIMIAVLAGLMLAAFARMGSFGIEPRVAVANAAAATEIQSISISSTCGTAGGFTGSVNLNGTFTGSITLGLFYHVPGNGTWFDSGVHTTVVFSGSSSETYNFGPYTNAAANSYRVQVIDGAGLNGSTTKSNSVKPCTPGTTSTTTSTSTVSSTSSSGG